MERDPRDACIEALRRGLDLGLTHIDTAEMYGSGEVERLVGHAIAGRRNEVFLASKVLPENASYEGTLRACEQSLARLGTDRLDLYMLHWPGRHPLGETFRAFETLREQGKVLRWGVSNFDVDDISRAVTAAGSADKIHCNQVLYHLGDRAIEHALIARCAEHAIPVVAYSPFGAGDFDESRALSHVAARHGKSARQIALAFLTRHRNVWAIPKAAQVKHVDDNAGAMGVHLSDDDVASIDAAHPLPRRRTLGYV